MSMNANAANFDPNDPTGPAATSGGGGYYGGNGGGFGPSQGEGGRINLASPTHHHGGSNMMMMSLQHQQQQHMSFGASHVHDSPLQGPHTPAPQPQLMHSSPPTMYGSPIAPRPQYGGLDQAYLYEPQQTQAGAGVLYDNRHQHGIYSSEYGQPGGDYYHHQQQQQGRQSYDHNTMHQGDGQYFGEQAHHHLHQPPQHSTQDYWSAGGLTTPPPDVPHGAYYPLSHSTPHLNGAPISALAYDPYSAALYVASHTQAVNVGGMKERPMGGNRAILGHAQRRRRNAMLSCHSLLDGSLYSSVMAHPEAQSHVLDTLLQVMYGSLNKKTGSAATSTTTSGSNVGQVGMMTTPAIRRKNIIPSHAYHPPYGSGTTSSIGNRAAQTTRGIPPPPPFEQTNQRPTYQMGINKILPFYYTKDAFVVTVSPAGARLHTRGGLLVSERSKLSGLICGTFNPPFVVSSSTDDTGNIHDLARNVTHVTVGGIPSSSSSSTTNATGTQLSSPPSRQQVLHCLDLYQGLRVVSAQSITATASPSKTLSTGAVQDNSIIGAMDMASNYDKNSLVVGCSDGTIRLFDGAWRGNGRMMGSGRSDLAKVKAHGGGVTKVAVSEDGNLICTTGYASRSSSSSTAYAFPDQHILIFDIRFLGRGGIVHPFSGLRGGPRFIHFLPSDPNHRILVGSGQSGGGLQIITPFENLDGSSPTSDSSAFLQPPLNNGEFITDICISGRDMAIGTSQSNLLQFRMAGYGNIVDSSVVSTSSGDYVPSTSSGGGRSVAVSSLSGGRSIDPPTLHDTEEKEPVVMPPFVPPPPALSIDPTVLRSDHDTASNVAANVPRSLFNAYMLRIDPTLTPLGQAAGNDNSSSNTFGPLSSEALVTPSRRLLSSELINIASKNADDFLSALPTSELGLVLLSKDNGTSPKFQRPTNSPGGAEDGSIPNPNKLLFSHKSSAICYEVNADPRAKNDRQRRHRGGKEDGGRSSELNPKYHIEKNKYEGELLIPRRYRLTARPMGYLATSFDYAKFNETGLWPGWDYPPSMPNAYVSSVLLLLYFIPEIRSSILSAQYDRRLFDPISKTKASLSGRKKKTYETGPFLSPELGFLFHQVDSLSAHAMAHPAGSNEEGNTNRPRVGPFRPSNFLTAFASLPEAAALALFDGSPGAVEIARRVEAFYRFLVHHLDRELSKSGSLESLSKGKESPENNGSGATNDNKLFDSLHGLDFTSVNEFTSGSAPPTVSSTRSLTVDLAYDPYISAKGDVVSRPYFGEVLRYSLCKERRLRAWCEATRAYATVVQRKIATSLPKILVLSCSCAGKKGNEEGLHIWRKDEDDNPPWLPEMVEVELEESGNIIVRELEENEGDTEVWHTFTGKKPLPATVSGVLPTGTTNRRKIRYELDAVISFVRYAIDPDGAGVVPASERVQTEGHHVLHVRVPKGYTKRALARQLAEAERCASAAESFDIGLSKDSVSCQTDLDQKHRHVTLTASTASEHFQKRSEIVKRRLEEVQFNSTDQSWLLVNGFVVSNTVSEDARAFHVPFKEPCLITFREVDSLPGDGEAYSESNVEENNDTGESRIPFSVMETPSISSGLPPKYRVNSLADLPGDGDLVAFDAEFVSVQHEKSVISPSGSRETITEGRHALARMSLIDCRTGNVIIDDHVLPREPVLDYLTRFSGIVATDLDPSNSSHHLVTTRNAYLKLRLLLDRGCIFVGHGLTQDFLTVNIFVPPSQIIDTVEIFHQEKMRHINLRFLANYLLGRDMQQDVHDSIEDARAAYEIYLKALASKKEGTFDKLLADIYEFGRRTDWKLGVEEVETKTG